MLSWMDAGSRIIIICFSIAITINDASLLGWRKTGKFRGLDVGVVPNALNASLLKLVWGYFTGYEVSWIKQVFYHFPLFRHLKIFAYIVVLINKSIITFPRSQSCSFEGTLLCFPTLLANFKDPIQNRDWVPSMWGELQIAHAPFYGLDIIF